VRAALEQKYTQPSPVQSQVIPHALAGRDVLACAQTGTGKTAAFVLPLLQSLAASESRSVRALVLTPTRELAGQIGERITAYGKYLGVRHAVIYGGVSQRNQERALRASPALLVATPGRLLDLAKQRVVNLENVTYFVLDEMDRMLDMGFVRDVNRVVEMIPRERQTLFFSATIAPSMEKLARSMLRDPARVAISPVVTTAPTVEQSVIFIAHAEKRRLLETVLRDDTVERVLVFTRTKHGANRLSASLERAGFGCAAIHGNKSQSARERALGAFRRGTRRCGAWDRRPGRFPGSQLRHAQRRRELRTPDRSYGTRRREGSRDLLLRSRRTGVSERHRAAHPLPSHRRGQPPAGLPTSQPRSRRGAGNAHRSCFPIVTGCDSSKFPGRSTPRRPRMGEQSASARLRTLLELRSTTTLAPEAQRAYARPIVEGSEPRIASCR
jgi:Lhr-like helicase